MWTGTNGSKRICEVGQTHFKRKRRGKYGDVSEAYRIVFFIRICIVMQERIPRWMPIYQLMGLGELE